MGSSVSMFDQPTNQPTNPLTPHPPFQLNFQASVGPFSLHLAAWSAKSPFLTSAEGPGISCQRLNHQSAKKYEKFVKGAAVSSFLAENLLVSDPRMKLDSR